MSDLFGPAPAGTPASASASPRAALLRILAACLPGQCLVCGDAAGDALCRRCAQAYWPAAGAIPRCAQCGIRLLSGSDAARARRPRCAPCRLAPPAFDATLALADYRPPLDILAITLKFRGRPALARDLADRLAAGFAKRIACALAAGHETNGAAADTLDIVPELLLPAPLSRRRLVRRGYNQAWELTRRLARQTGIPADPTLLLRRHTTAQSDLNLAARQRNLGRAFRLAPHAAARIAGAHVGLVDDVMTTGATLNALARVLKTAGARRVSNFVIFRTA
ncbi:ComF family protein [Robbsia sp. Bb-Pol-6]|uniref:ComF family protein n=1 Tax=Robbsia betulipollinis TaxID=2981849 RepID=A0ABT3ZLJ9_9BURK|nr:ComF family protein [Robbsia betulipollinis]MCY0387150.1 ComF family protein [Robbsia betulipollinis]